MTNSKLSNILIALVVALFILSAAIACPIMIRSLYYSQVRSLDLVERTGYSEEVIREAFDEMMDYCTSGGPNSGMKFGTGKLKWSEWGKTHFDDVAKLFSLDLNILKLTSILLILIFATRFFSKDTDEADPGEPPHADPRRGPFFWGPVCLLAIIAIVGAFAAVSFDAFFVKFHQVFFPGKENWIFDPAQDEIIKILPEEVFRNFAIVIAIVVLILCAISMAIDRYIKKKHKR